MYVFEGRMFQTCVYERFLFFIKDLPIEILQSYRKTLFWPDKVFSFRQFENKFSVNIRKVQIMKNNNNYRKVNWWYIGFVTMSNVVTWSKNRNSRWKFYGTLKFKGTNLLVSIHIWKSTSVSINSFIMNKLFNCILFFIVAVSAGSNYEDYYRSQV